MPSQDPSRPVTVRGTEIISTDSRQRYREKIARITLDSMVQFVGLLDAEGTVLEINKVALDAVGLTLSDVEGRPFWTRSGGRSPKRRAPAESRCCTVGSAIKLGADHVDWGGTSSRRMNPWVTVDALSVLAKAGRWTP